MRGCIYKTKFPMFFPDTLIENSFILIDRFGLLELVNLYKQIASICISTYKYINQDKQRPVWLTGEKHFTQINV